MTAIKLTCGGLAALRARAGQVLDRLLGFNPPEVRKQAARDGLWEDTDDLWPPDRSKMMEFGLRLPSGRVVWAPESYKGHGFDTPVKRATLFQVLRKTAEDLDFVESEFLANYRWITRDALTSILPITDPQAYEQTEEGRGPGDDNGEDSRPQRADDVATNSTNFNQSADQAGAGIAKQGIAPSSNGATRAIRARGMGGRTPSGL